MRVGSALFASALAGTLLFASDDARTSRRSDFERLLADGRRLLDLGEHPQALQSLEAALALCDAEREPAPAANCWRLIAEVHDGRRSHDDARRAHDRALELARRASDAGLEAKVLGGLGLSFRHQSRFQEAMDHFEAAMAIQRAIGQPLAEAASLDYLGELHLKRSGGYASARECFERALDLRRRAGDRAAESLSLEKLGDLAAIESDYASAVARYREALAIRSEFGIVRRQSILLNGIGNCFLMQGDRREARSWLEQALENARSAGDRDAACFALNRLGTVLLQEAEHQRALGCFSEAAAMRRAMESPDALAWNLVGLGHVHCRLGDLASALERYQEALDLFDGRNLRGAASVLDDLGGVHESLGDDPRAIDCYRRALETGDRAEYPYVALTLSSMARIHARRGEWSPALERCREAVARARRAADDALLSSALFALGRIETGGGDGAAAAAAYLEGLDLLERRRRRLVPLDALKLRFLEDCQEDYAAAVETLMGEERVEEALWVAERSRVRAFLDLLAERELGARAGVDAKLASLAAAPAPALEELRAEARARGSVIVTYFLAPRECFAWAIAPDGAIRAAAIGAPRERIESAVRSLQWALSPRPRLADPRPALRALHRLLIGPVAAWLPEDPEALVTFVPHGALHLVPFAALLDGDGRYLVEKRALHYGPSIAVLGFTRRAKQRIAGAAAPRLLIVGDPAMATPEGWAKPPRPLPGARAESLAVADLFPPADRVVLLGAAAAENTVRELASGFTVLHFATHAVLDRTALANAVILAPGGAGEPSDGLLRVREVFALDLEADLVTLSACDSGGGQVSADGILGLSRAFFCAGAASVLVSLWSVADESARPQMEAFYAECARNGWNKAAALRRAQLETLRRLRGGEIRTRSGKPLSENPILWAPFALIGEAGWMEPAEE
jgi:CHAT domain-containing protein/Tfp pilus assembly protein PilF